VANAAANSSSSFQSHDAQGGVQKRAQLCKGQIPSEKSLKTALCEDIVGRVSLNDISCRFHRSSRAVHQRLPADEFLS
jgi:hypothetical protein